MKKKKRSSRLLRTPGSPSTDLSGRSKRNHTEEDLLKEVERGNLLLELYKKAPQMSEKQLCRIEETLNRQYSTLRSIIDSTDALVFSVDRRYQYTSFNRAHAAMMKALYGAIIELNHSLLDYMTVTEDREKARQNIDRALAGERHVETAYSGEEKLSRLFFEVSHNPVFTENGSVIGAVVFAQDITGRKHAELEIARMNRALHMLSDTNQALLRIADEAILLNEVCRIAVDVGGYCMAWVGFAEHDEARTLRPVTHAGFESGYIESANVSWADNERGRGPGGIAIRTGQPSISHNIQSDPAFAPWREAAILRGYKSMIALPLISEGQTFGVMGIYASETDRFDPEEVEILKEMVSDLAFGITALRMQVKRNKSEEALRESEERYRALFQGAAEGILVADIETKKFMYANPAQCRMLGYTNDELEQMSIGDIHPKKDLEWVMGEFMAQARGEKTSALDIPCLRKDRSTLYADVCTTPIVINGKKCNAGFFSDITERKRAERQIVELKEFSENIIRNSPVGILTVEMEGQITGVNPAALKILGSPGEDKTKQFNVLTMENMVKQGISKYFERCLKHGEIITIECEYNSVWGKNIFISLNIVPLNSVDNKRVGAIALLEDVSDRMKMEKAIRESEEKYRTLVENAAGFIFSLDVQGNITYISPVVERLLGYQPVEVIGTSFLNYVMPDDLPGLMASMERTIAGHLKPYEFRVLHKNGSVCFVLTASNLILQNGKTVGLMGIGTDVTARRKAEEAVRESEERYRALFQRAAEGILVADIETKKIMYANPAQCRMLGYTNEELEQMSIADIHPKKDLEWVLGEFMAQARGEKTTALSIPCLRSDGSTLYADVCTTPIVINAIKCNVGFYNDITERKRAEDALRKSQENLTMITNSIDDVIYSINGQTGDFEYLSPAFERKFGYSLSDIQQLGGRWPFLMQVIPEVDPSSLDPVMNELKTIEAKSTPVWDHWWRCKDGSFLFIEDKSVPIYEGNRLLKINGILRDITERKRAEKEQTAIYCISESAQTAPSLDKLFGSIHKIIAELIPARNFYIALYNADTETIHFPYYSDEFDTTPQPCKLGKGLTDYVLSTGKPLLATPEVFEQLLQSGKVESMGAPSVDWLGVPLKTPRGETIGVMAVQTYTEDVRLSMTNKSMLEFVSTQVAMAIERKRAEEELRRLTHALEQSPVSVVMTNAAGDIEYVNPKFTVVTGYTKEEVQGKNPRILKSGEMESEQYKQLWETIKDGKEWRGEFHNRKKNGELFWEAALISSIRNEQGGITHFIAIKEDITERKRAEEELKRNEIKRHELERQLIQSQKIESLGTLASGIAHDFNNILGIIMGQSSLLRSPNADPAVYLRRIEAIEKASQRGASLVKQLLTFARKGESIFESVILNQIINEIIKLLQETFPKTIAISTDLKTEIPSIIADTTQMHQVLLNLCLNARDAMPNGGILTISTATIVIEEIVARFPSATARAYVLLSVTDTGVGMDDETKQRIFDPFFTTKGPGKGTGLGLALVYSIVESHHAMISVESSPRQGTKFNCYFPVEENRIESYHSPTNLFDDIPGGTGTILVIDDEEMLIEMIKDALVSKGYKVLIACDGEEGVALFAEHQKEISVVLSDMGLPKFGGDEVFKRIRAIDAKARVILASGFVDPEVKTEMLKLGVIYFIQKPYLISEVIRSIHDVLNAAK